MNISSARLLTLVRKDIEASYPILSGDHRKAFAAEQLCQSLVKKREDGEGLSPKRKEAIAVSNFLKVNSGISESFANDSDDPHVRQAIWYAKDRISRLFPGNAFYEPTASNGKFGPGASSGVSNPDLYGKFTDLTYGTVDALRFTTEYMYAATRDPGYMAEVLKRSTKANAKLTTVPKNDKTDRTIAVEPSANMFLQQAIRSDLERLLEQSYGIRLADQQAKNRKLAYIGSKANRYGTIDLSNASDTIGYAFAKWFLPRDLFAWLDAARSSVVYYGKETYEMRMLSSMGNATTFPVQCLIFASLVEGVYNTLGLRPATASRYYGGYQGFSAYGVNGDDIIVVRSAYSLMLKVLLACGFQPNPEKSFNNGGFRESCGGDYYFGYPCRGVYIKSLQCPQDVYSALNRLKLWSVFHGLPLRKTISFLCSQVKRLEGKVKGGTLRRVPVWMPPEAGVWDDSGSGKYRYWKAGKQVRTIDWYDTCTAWLVLLEGGLSTCSDNRLSVAVRPRDVSYKLRRGFSQHWGNPKLHVTTWWMNNSHQELGVPFNIEWHNAHLGPGISHLGF